MQHFFGIGGIPRRPLPALSAQVGAQLEHSLLEIITLEKSLP